MDFSAFLMHDDPRYFQYRGMNVYNNEYMTFKGLMKYDLTPIYGH